MTEVDVFRAVGVSSQCANEMVRVADQAGSSGGLVVLWGESVDLVSVASACVSGVGEDDVWLVGPEGGRWSSAELEQVRAWALGRGSGEVRHVVLDVTGGMSSAGWDGMLKTFEDAGSVRWWVLSSNLEGVPATVRGRAEFVVEVDAVGWGEVEAEVEAGGVSVSQARLWSRGVARVAAAAARSGGWGGLKSWGGCSWRGGEWGEAAGKLVVACRQVAGKGGRGVENDLALTRFRVWAEEEVVVDPEAAGRVWQARLELRRWLSFNVPFPAAVAAAVAVARGEA